MFSCRLTGGFILAASMAISAAIAPAQEPAQWKAGVASVVVTPKEPIFLMGFASRDRPSDGITADLRVKALALQDQSGKTTVIVTAALIGFNKNLSDIIAKRCQKQYGLTRDRLMLNASHTHSGPVLSLDGGGPSSKRTPHEKQVIADYTKDLLDKIVDLVGRAVTDLAPAKLQFDQGLAGFAVNRRRSRPNTRQFPGPVDHDVPVLAVRAPDGKLRAILFGYACHATTMSAYQINADYPGYAQTELERLYPGVVAMFVQGCGADSNPLPRFHSDDPALVQRSLALCIRYGKTLADAVDLVLRGKMAPVAGPLTTVFDSVEIPFEPLPSRSELEARLKDPDINRRDQAQRTLKALDAGTKIPERTPYAIQILHFGSGLNIIALSGEVVVDYSLRLKAAHGWDDTWVAGYSNEMPGYIPSKRVVLEGGYETRGGPGGSYSTAVEETIVEKVARMVRGVEPESRP